MDYSAACILPDLLHRDFRGVLHVLHVDGLCLAGQVHRVGKDITPRQGVLGVCGVAEVEVIVLCIVRFTVPHRRLRFHNLVEGIVIIGECRILLLPGDVEDAGVIGGIGIHRCLAVGAAEGIILVDAEFRSCKADIIVAFLNLVEGVALVRGNTGGIAGVLPLRIAAGMVIGFARALQRSCVGELQVKLGIVITTVQGNFVRHSAGNVIRILEHQTCAVRDSRGGNRVCSALLVFHLGRIGPDPVGDFRNSNPFSLGIIPLCHIQLHAALNQGSIDIVFTVDGIVEINLVGIGHGIHQGQGVLALHQIVTIRVQDNGVIHDSVGVIPSAGFVHHLSVVGPFLGLFGGAYRGIRCSLIVQPHFGFVRQGQSPRLAAGIGNLAVDGQSKFGTGLNGIVLGLGCYFQGDNISGYCPFSFWNRLRLIGASDIIPIGVIRSGN